MRQDLINKVALVTGGSKGIGLGLAEALVDSGVNVTITARSKSEVEAVAAELNARGGGYKTRCLTLETPWGNQLT